MSKGYKYFFGAIAVFLIPGAVPITLGYYGYALYRRIVGRREMNRVMRVMNISEPRERIRA